jgi:hypothetical protein
MQEQELLFSQSAGPPPPGPVKDERSKIKDERSKTGAKRVSKKSVMIDLFTSGVTDLAEIARRVRTRPSYVASVLQGAGLIHGYFDLYTTTGRDQNLYSRFFRNILSFKSVEAAKESIEQIARLYNYFERIGDRAGQHHAEVLALTGRNRARFSGKREEASVFEQWLFNH